MIEHFRGRDRKLEQLGWTGDDAEWITLVCLHSGVFTRAQFCHYFNAKRMIALRFVKTLIERRVAVETDLVPFNGGGKNVPHIEQGDLPGARRREHTPPPSRQQHACHAAAFVAGFCSGTHRYELAPRRAGEGRVF